MRPVMNKIFNWKFPHQEKIWIFVGVLLLALGIVYAITVKVIFGVIIICVFAVPTLITGFLITKKMYKTMDVLVIIALVVICASLYDKRGKELIWGLITTAFFIFAGIYSIIYRRRKAKEIK